MAAAGNHDGSISSEAMKGIHPDHHVMNQRNQSIHPDFFNMALKDHTMRSSGKGDIGEMALENSEKTSELLAEVFRGILGHPGARPCVHYSWQMLAVFIWKALECLLR